MKRSITPSVFLFLSFFFLFFFFLHDFVFPQGDGFLDSIQSSLRKKPRFIVSGATKNTFIGGFRSPVFTVRAGLDFDHRIRMGIGISWFKLPPYVEGKDNTPFYLNTMRSDGTATYTVQSALQFEYINLFTEYFYYRKNKWQFSIPIQFGAGRSRYRYHFKEENIIENRHFILLYEPAVSGQYRITKWFGAGLEVGYRIMIITNKNIGTRFNSPVYDIKATIFWGELYNAVFGVQK